MENWQNINLFIYAGEGFLKIEVTAQTCLYITHLIQQGYATADQNYFLEHRSFIETFFT